MDILLSHINKTYTDSGENRVIFQDMEAVFPSGKFSVIVGKSGMGKSSLLNLISGIDLPDKGLIEIGKNRISGMDDSQRTLFRRKHIGFIYQFFNLIPVLTVLENVTLISELDGRHRASYLERAESFLEQVGLYHRRNDYPDRLSGGEQQRIAIVRSLVNDPEIILADEPTGNLDIKTGHLILEMIADLAVKNDKTLVMVTHSPEALEYADHLFSVTSNTLVPQSFGRI